jgi:tRNA(Ile)-lysidine synthase
MTRFTTRALTLAELAASLDSIGGFEAQPEVAIAVSGGPDSMALVLLADKWARQRGGRVWALTVDHGLRPESAAEARTVAGWLAGRSIAHEILMWAGDKPSSGIQEAARDARYRLMAEWCRTHGCLHLVTAHHREDQVETHLIRRRAGSGADGLAGMSAVRELAGCRLVRPLLSVPRARLQAVLAQEGQPFLRDPSNLNPAFERARLRAALEAVIPGCPEGTDPQSINTSLWNHGSGFAASPRPGMTLADHFIQEIRVCGAARIEREQALDDLLARAVSLHPAGFAMLEISVLSGADPESAERLLGRVAAALGAARHPARRARLGRLRAGLAAAPDRARTLGGCRFVPWRGRLLVLRELGAASAPVRLDPGARLVWDRRFAADLASAAPSGFILGHLGQSAATASELTGRPTAYRMDGPMARPVASGRSDLPRLIYPILPALWDAEGLAAVPHLGYRRPGLAVLPSLSFRPANPLTSAGFTVV